MRVRIRFSLPGRRRHKSAHRALSPVTVEQTMLAAGEGSQLQPVVRVTSSPGSLASGPKVEIALKLVGQTGLIVEMRADEAADLANELLIAVRMSERKYALRFGMDWRGVAHASNEVSPLVLTNARYDPPE